MPIEFQCIECRELLRVPDNASGKRARCPKCSAVVDVPLVAKSLDGEGDEEKEPTGPSSSLSRDGSVSANDRRSVQQPSRQAFADRPSSADNPFATPASLGAYGSDTVKGATLVLARRGERFMARIIDNGIAFAMVVPALFAIKWTLGGQSIREYLGIAFGTLLAVIFPIANSYLICQDGRSLGKRFVGLQVVDERTAAPVGFYNGVFLREIMPFLLMGFCWVGRILAIVNVALIFQESRQCLHDQIASTRVIVYRPKS